MRSDDRCGVGTSSDSGFVSLARSAYGCTLLRFGRFIVPVGRASPDFRLWSTTLLLKFNPPRRLEVVITGPHLCYIILRLHSPIFMQQTCDTKVHHRHCPIVARNAVPLRIVILLDSGTQQFPIYPDGGRQTTSLLLLLISVILRNRQSEVMLSLEKRQAETSVSYRLRVCLTGCVLIASPGSKKQGSYIPATMRPGEQLIRTRNNWDSE